MPGMAKIETDCYCFLWSEITWFADNAFIVYLPVNEFYFQARLQRPKDWLCLMFLKFPLGPCWPEPLIRVAEICTNPIAAYRSGPAPRLLWWRIGGIGQKLKLCAHTNTPKKPESPRTSMCRAVLVNFPISMSCLPSSGGENTLNFGACW